MNIAEWIANLTALGLAAGTIAAAFLLFGSPAEAPAARFGAIEREARQIAAPQPTGTPAATVACSSPCLPDEIELLVRDRPKG